MPSKTNSWQIRKSDLFKRQLIDFAINYKDRAGAIVAENFITSVESALNFIQTNPLACPLYLDAQSHELLKAHNFRKWTLDAFPHSIYFRVNDTIISIEVIYAHRMHSIKRLAAEIDGMDDRDQD